MASGVGARVWVQRLVDEEDVDSSSAEESKKEETADSQAHSDGAGLVQTAGIGAEMTSRSYTCNSH